MVLLKPNHLPAKEFHGITSYYIRLDHHFASQRATTARVTMVPAENEFRAEKFSLVLIEGTIKTDRQNAARTVAAMAKKDAFARMLKMHGLKSVQTMNLNTTISYEGVIISPADIFISPYDPVQGGYPYTASIRFSPLAFPDRWEALKQQYNARQILNDFFLLFK